MAEDEPIKWIYEGVTYEVEIDEFFGHKNVASVTSKSNENINVNTQKLWKALINDSQHTDEMAGVSRMFIFTTGEGNDTVYRVGAGTFTNDGNDRINQVTIDGALQSHVYAGRGDDIINMNFQELSQHSNGHHVFGDIHRNKSGEDNFNFLNIANVGKFVVVGRIDDFDPTWDTLRVEKKKIDLYNLPTNMKVVSFNGEHNDPDTHAQRWLVIKNEQGGILFYALDGARVDMIDPEGGSKIQETHFVSTKTLEEKANTVGKTLNDYIWDLPSVKYENEVNYVPKWAGSVNGRVINDRDRIRDDVGEAVEGSNKDDLIAGGLNDDVIKAGAGADRVWGGTENDQLYGGVGDDKLYGGSGKDTLHGGAGHDKLYGGKGANTLYGDDDNDSLYGGNLTDKLYGGKGNDFLRDDHGAKDVFNGGAGNDTASYLGWFSDNENPGRTLTVDLASGYNNAGGDVYRSIENLQGSNRHGDILKGDGKSNKLWGLGGNDVLHGRDGNDRLDGGHGTDKLYGGKGNDFLRDDHGANDIFSGGAGNDTASYLGWFSDNDNPGRTLTVDLASGYNNAGGDVYRSIENLQGSSRHGDILKGDGKSNKLWGLGGNDVLHGRDGNDRLYGGHGTDKLYGGKGNDFLRDDHGAKDIFSGGAGNDTASYLGWFSDNDNPGRTLTVDLASGYNNAGGDVYRSIENLQGSSRHGDILKGDGKSNKLWGLGGNDVLEGRGGNDRLIGGKGDDVFVFDDQDGKDWIHDLKTGTGNSGHDVIRITSDRFDSYADIQSVMSQSSNSVAINFGSGHSINIAGTQLSEMNADMFDFV